MGNVLIVPSGGREVVVHVIKGDDKPCRNGVGAGVAGVGIGGVGEDR